MHQFMENSIKWLTNRPVGELDSVVIAHMDQSYYFPDYNATRDWLLERTGTSFGINDRTLCDDLELNNCLFDGEKPDLLIISQNESGTTQPVEVADSVSQALAAKIPVLYLHHNGNLTDLGAAIFNNLRVTYSFDNYWPKLRITQSAVDDMIQGTATLDAQLLYFFDALENDDWSFNLENCDQNCANQTEYSSQFLTNANAIKTMLNNLDKAGTYIFDEPGYMAEKLAVLLADKYREEVTYPMDISSTPRQDFLRAIFTDYAQYQRRAIVPVPSDLGNFSRTEFPNVTLVDKSIHMVSRVSFRASGVYALPGETVAVTRTDSEDTTVHVQVNSIRTGATHIWDEDGYTRPVQLTSQKMSLEPGETLTFTSTYGGPIHLYFSANEQNVSFDFKNVGLHPFWNGPEDDVSFQAGLDADQFDWAELTTPAFEVHSKIEKMRESANDTNWPNGAALAEATMTYTHNYPHILAGFQGPGIDVVDEIHDFANDNGWTIDTLDKVKHMNADQATCGYGCSGNPYDAYWSFNPIGHGDIHELGHGLERGRFRFKNENGTSWETHATTNPYSYYSKSKYYEQTGQDPSCQNLPFEAMYDRLQAAQATSDPFNAMAQLNLTAWNSGVVTYIQWMMAAENQGVLEDGWHLWARLHMFDREFNRADNSEDTWSATKANLGMSNLSLAEAKALNNNDWMVMALSFITGRDYRPMFELYGIGITDIATTQLNLLNYPEIQATFYGADGSDFCLGFDKAELPLDGTSVWPY
jgi:hypothetical protein